LSQHLRTVTVSSSTEQNRSGFLLIGASLLWLLLAAALLVYQFGYPANVEITWETATEQQTAGYNIYRSSDPAGLYVLVNTDQFINSEGDSLSGATYSFIDDDVKAGETYLYMLEEIESDGTQIRYEDDIIEYTVPKVAWWVAILIAGSSTIGAALFVSGLKELGKR
jgi:hypothetical protein